MVDNDQMSVIMVVDDWLQAIHHQQPVCLLLAAKGECKN